ncbi:non-ribosomal peptide synthetase [Kitasatospora sp. MAA4]|uniref:non-ribosomal peptide synthetase n=1 Tax=Kitasatospora sp. MAA4 TaxID=3035093 RepID=UPI002473E77D|nr:non-ribosomal peptide synthetase [Kitasatospora sp. MAA4]
MQHDTDHDSGSAATPLSLTGAQRGVWYGQQLDPASPAYNTAEFVEIQGPVDRVRFEEALRTAVTQAEALHARFGDDSGEPRQTLGETAWQLRTVDVSGESDPWSAADRWMREDLRQPFDLTCSPLFGHALITLSAERVLWYQRAHHIVLDGYGFSLLARRVAEVYGALVNDRRPPANSFGSFDELLRNEEAYRGSEQCERDRAYWLDQFADLPRPAVLAELSAPVSAGFRRERAGLPAGVAEQVARTAELTGAVTAEVMIAAVAAYTYRRSGSADVVLGVPVMNRGSAAARVPSMMVNVTPLRLRLRPQLSFAELVAEVSGALRGTRAHRRYRYEDIRRDLGLVGDNRRLFGPMVNIKPFSGKLDFGGLRGVVHQLSAGPVEDLTVNVVDDPSVGGPVVEIDTNPATYSADETADHLARFLRLLDALTARPEAALAEAGLLAPEELLKLAEWNDTARALPAATLPELVEAQVARTPEATAVRFEGEQLDFAELNRRANQLARLLAARGAGPGRIVAVALPRSIELVVALLAVLKSGAAYAPLDLDHPAGRLAAILEDTDPVAVVTDTAAGAALPDGAPVLLLDDARTEALDEGDLCGNRPAPEDTAYVIHTSGSTGRPKGAALSHRAICNRLLWMQDTYGLGADDRVLQKTSSGFDVSVWEFFWPLITGATLVAARPGGHKDPAYLAELIHQEGVTTAHFVPAMLSAYLAEPACARPTRLRRIICSGEALPADLATRAAQVLGAPVHNLYGPTEAAVDVTAWVHGSEPTAGVTVPIGRPVWNTRTHVLDAFLQPVVPGAVGELYLAGVQLATAYLGRPALTAQSFVADPFGPAGSRMYRTGDLVRQLPQGELEYLGRTDHQVKLRGLRIELGEIESTLTTHDGIDAAVVLLRTEHTERLVAYVVPRAGAEADPDGWRAHLARSLPEYMVPAVFTVLDALPVTANGKVDRAALPAPQLPGAADDEQPATVQERILCEVFAQVLGLPRVGPTDSFFALGGHSLSAARVAVRARTALGLEVSIGDLFQEPTAVGLAARLHRALPARPPVRPLPRPELLPLSFAQQSMWFLNQLDTSAATYNIPLVVRLEHEVDHDALRAALADVTDRHESLRTLLPQAGGSPRQEVRAPGTVRPVLRVVDCPQQEVQAHVADALRHPFDLTQDPPLWAGLYGTGPAERVLVIVVHHSAADGWSLRPLAQDLSTAYAARLEGRAPQWQPLPVQYADYTLWQRSLLEDRSTTASTTVRQLAFWRAALTGLPEETPLPVDRSRPQLPTRRGAGLALDLDPDLHGGLLRLAEENGSSLFMVLHSALAALLTRTGAGTDIAIGTPVAGRSDEALDDLVGLVANTLVLRTDTSGDPDFRDLLARVRAFDLAAFDHQELPFDLLVEELNPARHQARHPLFQVMLALQNNSEAVLSLGANQVPLEPSSTGTAKFDLFLNVLERRTADGDPAGLACQIEYSTDLFDPDTVRQLADTLHGLLAAVADDPALRISALPAPDRSAEGAAGAEREQDGGFDPELLERELLALGGIRECVALAPAANGAGRPRVLAVPTRTGVLEQAAKTLRRRATDPARAPRVAGLSDLPRHPDGTLDTIALEQLPLLDGESAEQWERALTALPGVLRASVALEEIPEELGRLSVGPVSARRPAAAQAEAAGPAAAPVPALSEGPALPEPDLHTWSQALSRAAEGGEHAEVVHVRPDGTETRRSYASLLAEASHVLGGLRKLGLRPGDQVILQCEDTEDFLAALWGCVLGGFVTVPLTVPVSYQVASAPVTKLEGVREMLHRPWIVTSAAGEAGLRELAGRRNWSQLRLATIDALRESPADPDWHPAQPDDALLMLLTSGSTGLPKAVRLSHRNVLTRSAATAAMNSLTEQDVSLNWIPLDHVTGVVMFHLRDVFLGCRQVHAPTSWILQDPLRWMDLADRHRVSVTWAPNFAFGLVAEQAERMADRHWDLTPMRLVTNAGEVVVAATSRKFLKVLKPFGLPQNVMHPGWGMSETSSVVTDTELSAEPSGADETFVSCGRPYPGFAMRILDDRDLVVAEGTVGRLQVRGSSVTSGYHDNPRVNAESFTVDGWFETGDLAFLRAGELYITGRAKDVIIVNGVNHHSHEIESCVEELPFVVRSFTAACAVRSDPTASTDELALFFHLEPGQDLAQALRAIRGKVTREIGVSPAHLVAVEAATIPKTEIGKIQRTQLRKRFEAGEFDEAARACELLLDSAASVPDWFLRPVWQRAQPVRPSTWTARHTLVLAGRHAAAAEVAEALAAQLRHLGSRCTIVTAADAFERLDAARYRLRVDAVEDHHLLLAGLADDGRPVDAVLHLGALGAAQREPDSVEALLAAQRDSADSLLCLAQALTAAHSPDHRVSLHLVTGDSRTVRPEDGPGYAHAAAGGLLKSLPEELPWLSTCLLDVSETDPERFARLLLAEAAAPVTDPEVAYRGGQRWVRRLAQLPVPLPRTDPAAPDGFQLISGGLGGVATALAQHLLRTPGTRLLLLGRTELPEQHTWAEHLARGGELARRIEAYRSLCEQGEVRYEAADITDPAQVRAAVDKAASHWSAPLAGVLHLAGTFDQRPAAGYELAQWRAELAAKVTGGWVLHRLAVEHSAVSFLSFSSVNGFFGGSLSGGYSAANAFLDALAAHQRRHCGLDARSLAWSMWDEVGMSRGFTLKALTEARGYQVLETAAALRSFELARRVAEPHLLIGVHRGAPWVRGHLLAPAQPVHRLAGQVVLRDGADLGALHRAADDAARGLGADDRWVLRAAGSPSPQTGLDDAAAARSSAEATNRRALEQTLSAIWGRALGRDRIGVEENFFDLGGNSLLLVGVQTTVNQELGCDLSVVDLFSHPTVEALARHLDESGTTPADAGADTPTPTRPAPGAALDRARQQAERRQAARTRTNRPNRRTENDG